MTPLPTPQQLRYLINLAETGHFGRAALACAVSQSTLSAGILVLERQLGARILDRTAGKHVVFTPLGIIPTIGPFLLPRLMPELRGQFPNLRLFLREDQTERLLDQLEAGQLDALLIAEPCACGGAETLPVWRDEFLAALPKGHLLAARDSVPMAALAAERLLLLEDGHCLRDQVLTACGPLAGRPAEFAATSLHTLIQMVAGGLGVTLVPRLAVSAGITAGTDVVLRRLDGAGGWRSIALGWRPGAARAAEYRALGPLIAGCLRDGA
jgi:LysR family hydrogen peroxide-inducible transcriptional activator